MATNGGRDGERMALRRVEGGVRRCLTRVLSAVCSRCARAWVRAVGAVSAHVCASAFCAGCVYAGGRARARVCSEAGLAVRGVWKIGHGSRSGAERAGSAKLHRPETSSSLA